MSLFQVSLTQELPVAPFPKTNLVSVHSSGAKIHLKDTQNWSRIIQKSARKIAALGVVDIEFTGQWTNKQQQVFVQSFCGSDYDGNLVWAHNSNQSLLSAFLECLLFTRRMINATPQDMSPEILAERSVDWLQQLTNNQCTARLVVGEQLKQEGWMGIYEVGRGSDRPPVLLELDFNPDNQEKVDVALVGKGITFDSGGYSIKASESMLDMKCDMGGAATLVGALGYAIKKGLKKRVKLYLCCAENLISGHAYKLGDIITYKNGTTVEIVNTDAEGRLVLADGLLAASQTKAPLIIDAATLTGAAVAAVGREYNALFSLHQKVATRFLSHAESQLEPFWQLPLELWHQHQCPSPFADTANSRPQKGGGAGGASNAAGFLSRFVDLENCSWLHLDLAAAYNRNATDMLPAGGSAIGIKTIAKALLSI